MARDDGWIRISNSQISPGKLTSHFYEKYISILHIVSSSFEFSATIFNNLVPVIFLIFLFPFFNIYFQRLQGFVKQSLYLFYGCTFFICNLIIKDVSWGFIIVYADKMSTTCIRISFFKHSVLQQEHFF